MSVARVAVVTSDDGVECDVDLPLIVDALRAGGLSAEPVVWDTAAVPWERFGLAVIRSTWDYVERLDEFLTWADATAAVTRLWNPAPIVRWNSDKHYLAGLARHGVAVTPTRFLEPGTQLQLTPADFGAADGVVVKPAVSAGALDTARYEPGQHVDAARHARMLLHQNRSVMVQPYLPRVAEGERALIFVDGTFSHAIRKDPLLTEPGVIDNDRVPHLGVAPYQPIEAEIRTASAALAAVPSPSAPLFARVDLVLNNVGEPVVLELELIEPNLFLQTNPEGLGRFFEAVAVRAGAQR
ncbi:hypothetical protein ABTY61_34625 [Kitasatospora sp. NPDC096128]|uniref:ATP-grasp domain-containing protein n=1 Tax=Kitasatospora sp. NPDC096128 TaxID=3155547 RepID=UPI003330E9B7